MDLLIIIGAIFRQFTDLSTPFAVARALVLSLTLILVFVRGFRGRKAAPRTGLNRGDAILVGMLSNLVGLNAMFPLMEGLPTMIQATFGFSITSPSIVSGVMAIALLMLMLAAMAVVALVMFVLVRGLGATVGRALGGSEAEASETDTVASEAGG